MDKSEIKKLPEGMSSEELDALTTGEEPEDTELAKEALDATGEESLPAEETVKEEPAEPEETPPAEETAEPELSETEQQLRAKDSKIAAMKHEAKEQAIEKARLEGELQARKDLQTKTDEPPPKSPLEIAEAAYKDEYGSLDGFAMNGELYRQQKAFDDEQSSKKATDDSQDQVDTAAVQAEHELQEGDLSAEKMGKGLDLESVATVGNKYLTRGDRLDIFDIVKSRGSKAGLKEAYNRMVQRTLAAGGDDAKLIQGAMNTKKTKKSQTKPKKEPTDIDALTTEGEDTDTGEAETETHSKRLTDFIFEE